MKIEDNLNSKMDDEDNVVLMGADNDQASVEDAPKDNQNAAETLPLTESNANNNNVPTAVDASNYDS